MTYACSDCSNCGKCYPKYQPCPSCGRQLYLLDDACGSCGAPVTDAMRDTAKKEFMAKRAQDRQHVIELAQEAKRKRMATEKKVVYPWDQ